MLPKETSNQEIFMKLPHQLQAQISQENLDLARGRKFIEEVLAPITPDDISRLRPNIEKFYLHMGDKDNHILVERYLSRHPSRSSDEIGGITVFKTILVTENGRTTKVSTVHTRVMDVSLEELLVLAQDWTEEDFIRLLPHEDVPNTITFFWNPVDAYNIFYHRCVSNFLDPNKYGKLAMKSYLQQILDKVNEIDGAELVDDILKIIDRQ